MIRDEFCDAQIKRYALADEKETPHQKRYREK
jgi:hypothetical protein